MTSQRHARVTEVYNNRKKRVDLWCDLSLPGLRWHITLRAFLIKQQAQAMHQTPLQNPLQPLTGACHGGLSLSLQGPQSAGQSSARQQPPSTIKKKRQKKKGHVLDLWPIFNKPQHLLREPIKHHGKQSASSNTHICLLLPNVPIMMFDFPLCSNER